MKIHKLKIFKNPDPVPDPAGSHKIWISFRPNSKLKKRSGSGSGRILN